VLWGKPILSEQEQAEWRQRLGDLKRFLESLQAFNTAGKLKSFPHDVAAIQAQRPGLALVREVEELGELVQQVGPTTSYLGKAEAVLQAATPGSTQMRSDAASSWPRSPARSTAPTRASSAALGQALAELKGAYQDAYLQQPRHRPAWGHRRPAQGPAGAGPAPQAAPAALHRRDDADPAAA
jgi:hypothetical protein